jgi:hypothetical protein
MSPLQRLADALAELAETGDAAELAKALGLCLGFADTIMREADIDEAFAEGRERSETKTSAVRRISISTVLQVGKKVRPLRTVSTAFSKTLPAWLLVTNPCTPAC